MEVLAIQEQLSDAIKNYLRNFKKDGADRKTSDLIKKRIEKLDLYWCQYQENHRKLCQVLQDDHEYFIEDEYNTTQGVYQETREFLIKYPSEHLQPSPAVRVPQHKDKEDTAENVIRSFSWAAEVNENQKATSRGTYSQLDDMMKKQVTNFKAFARTVSQINVDTITEKWEFEDTLRSLHSRWQAIDSLHWEIDSILNGSDISYETDFTQHEKKYNNIKRAINNKLWSVSHREKSTPQLDIPVFTGNYQQWSSFKDLFCETIHNNPALSNAQKMQHLKSKLRGEAERLIQHLQIGSENYLASWDILNHRYNNKKLIFTSHMNILMSMPVIQQVTSNQVKRIHDVTTECINAIKNLGVDIDSWDPILIHILSQKLDAETHSEYMSSLKDPRELPKMIDFIAFLENKFTTMESSRRKQEPHQRPIHASSPSVKQEYIHQTRRYPQNSSNKAIFQQTKSSRYKLNCVICDSNEHGIYYCKRFLEMTPMQKRQAITKLNYCVNCLCSHYGKNCTSSKRCRDCDGNHNTLLHEAFAKFNNPVTKTGNQGTSSQPTNTYTAQQWEAGEVLLATAVIMVTGVDGVSRKMRALIDPGSQISIITENAAQQLRLPRQKCSGVITGVGTKDTNCRGKIAINCSSLIENFSFTTEALIMNKLTKNLPNFTFKKPDWGYLNKLSLADPEFYISRPIDILLGADVYASILMEGIRKADNTRPVAQQTLLGWILYGKTTTTLQCNVVLNNIEDIQRFWEIEDISSDSLQSADEQECINFYKSTTSRKNDGKYQVRLPLKKDVNELGQSRNKAMAQYLQLEKKFKEHRKIADEYKSFIQEYQELGHMQKATGNTTPEYFLPHHCVIRESTTTSLRVVFNASQNTSNGKSLNDYMYKGPNLQQDLFTLILKWRQYCIAFTADIEKMFRQIWVHPDDLKYQKILWRDDPNQVVKEYELTTVTYGTKAAPFLAMMTLRQLAQDERKTFPEAAEVVETSFYMDDLLQGSHSLEDAIKIKQDLINLLKTGGFNLRKWTSNYQELLHDNQKAAKQDEYDFKHSMSTKTLGLRWDPVQDKFIFESTIDNPTDNNNNTKRKLLSDISKLFDPQGWLTPISTKLKLLFQQVWEKDIPWDVKIPDNINKEWIKLKQDLININKINIPRWLGIKPDTDIELHGFCDASQKAYACVIYCKLPSDPDSKVILVVAKSKLVPRNKDISLPRLELLGAHLLSQLMQKVEQCLSKYKVSTYGWTDSTAVLGWIQGNQDRWNTFVSNRVRKITTVLPAEHWRYVKSADNPADCASRGITPSQLQQHSLWWQGPAWLYSFQNKKSVQKTYFTNEELRKNKQVNLATQSTKQENIIKNLLEKYSSLSRATRVLGWVRRFISRGTRKNEPYLTLLEVKQAKNAIIKETQAEEYKDEIANLKINKPISPKSKILCLNPYLDQEGLLRVGGRLQNAHINTEMMHPIILPYNSRLTDLIIDDAHKLTYHGGARVTLAFIRQKYWLISGNRATKKYIRTCVTCKKQKPVKQEQIMGQLPGARVNQSRPFLHTGVDFTGHVFVKANKGRGIKTLKAYIAVFVCMVTKAVHLELVSDLTTSSFLAALRRMAARRGKPSHMYSDNGRNFVGASKVLQQEYEDIRQVFTDKFMTEIVDMEITWHFNAPAWPSAGGIFEAAVKSFKFHLKRVIGQQALTFEEFSTLLAQIEGCLNSRPLCALSEDPEDLNFLTPSHFLTGGPLLTIVETERDTRTRWQLTQKILQDVWTRWRSEYLTQLTSRSKWRKPHQNVKIDDVVIIHDEHLPPGKWVMGRVVDTHPGQDGHVRVVSLKTKSGYIKRPVTKISILTEHQEYNQKDVNKQDTNQTKNDDIDKNNARTRRHKTKKFTFTTLFTAFLMFMTFISSAYGMANITTFKENQGLYFDKLSNMQLIKDEWKLITYFDMEPYWQGTQALEKYLKTLEKSCELITREKIQCNAITLQLGHQYTELEYYNHLLLNQQIRARAKHARRTRRGFINAIGYLAGDLFGVLDERFAKQYKQDINLLRGNQDHLINLWKNQTSIVEAENNLLKRTEEMMNQQHKTANQHILALEKAMDDLKNAAEVNLILNDFALESIIASNMLNNLRVLQNTLLQTITEIHQGYFNVHILTPDQLIKELSTISSQLPQDVSLPVNNIHSDLRKMYEFLSIRTRILDEYFIFEIRIPLISRDAFEILRIIPLPKYQDKKMISLVPVADYVSVNMKKDLFIPMSENDIQTCLHQDDTYFCRNQGPEYQMKADKNLCRLEESECMTEVKSCQDVWKESYFINTYIYSCCRPCQVRVMCGDQITAHQLSGSGLITIGHGCIIKTEKFSIYPHRYHTSEIKVSPDLYTPTLAPINNIINLTIPHFIKDMEASSSLQEEAFEIGNKIKAVKTDEEGLAIGSETVSFHDIHHYVMIYIVMSVVTIAGIIWITRRLPCRRRVSVTSPEPITQIATREPSPTIEAHHRPAPAHRTTPGVQGPQRVDRNTSPKPRVAFTERFHSTVP